MNTLLNHTRAHTSKSYKRFHTSHINKRFHKCTNTSTYQNTNSYILIHITTSRSLSPPPWRSFVLLLLVPLAKSSRSMRATRSPWLNERNVIGIECQLKQECVKATRSPWLNEHLQVCGCGCDCQSKQRACEVICQRLEERRTNDEVDVILPS